MAADSNRGWADMGRGRLTHGTGSGRSGGNENRKYPVGDDALAKRSGGAGRRTVVSLSRGQPGVPLMAAGFGCRDALYPILITTIYGDMESI